MTDTTRVVDAIKNVTVRETVIRMAHEAMK